MQKLKIVPISTAVAETVRATLKAPVYGSPLAAKSLLAARLAGNASNSFGRARRS